MPEPEEPTSSNYRCASGKVRQLNSNGQPSLFYPMKGKKPTSRSRLTEPPALSAPDPEQFVLDLQGSLDSFLRPAPGPVQIRIVTDTTVYLADIV